MDFLKFFIPLYLLAGKKVSYYLLCTSFFEELAKSMRCVSCCDDVVDKKDFLAFERLFPLGAQGIFFPNSATLVSCST